MEKSDSLGARRRPPVHLTKTYNRPFLLDESKLRRVAAVVQAKLPDAATDVSLSHRNGRSESVGSLEEALDLDNLVHAPLTELRLDFNAGADRCSVTFASEPLEPTIRVGIEAHREASTGGDLLAALEEQIERTFQSGLIYRLKGVGTGTIMFMLAFIAIGLMVGRDVNRAISEAVDARSGTEEERREELRLCQQPRSLEQKVDCLVAVERHRIAHQAPRRAHRTMTALDLTLLGGVAVVIGIFIYLWSRCYPTAVFCWGDVADHYKTILERRKHLWWAVFVAIAANVFGSAISTRFVS